MNDHDHIGIGRIRHLLTATLTRLTRKMYTQRMVPNQGWGCLSFQGLIFLLVACRFTLATTTTSPAHRLDLSYLHQVKPSGIAKAIRQSLEENANVWIDVSSSLLGKGAKDLIESLQPSTPTTIQLAARRNQWSPDDATLLFNAILGKEEEKPKGEITKRREAAAEDFNTTDTQTDSNATGAELEKENLTEPSFATIASLDLGWNDFSQNAPGSKIFLKSLQKLVESGDKCPQTLRLDVCGLGPGACRALGKGLINRYEKQSSESVEIKPISLHLCRNEAIGDSGVAALSAAIRTISSKNEGVVIFDCLDLSACGVGDAGVEALSIAFEKNPCCVRHLILSDNHISDEGAAALGRALSADVKRRGLDTLDLSNNKDIGDSGATAIALALEKRMISNIVIRSCQIHADGASSFGKALKSLVSGAMPPSLNIDLSGNPLGILRKKAKSGGYSATAIKSKASATTAAYMSLINKTVQKGLKDLGVAGPSTVESDDEEEGDMDEEQDKNNAESKKKCGLIALANAFLDTDTDDESAGDAAHSNPVSAAGRVPSIRLDLRRCWLDTLAAEALAAVVQKAKESFSIDLTMDATMNYVLEDEMVEALRGDSAHRDFLHEMAERHLEAMEFIRISKQRAKVAAEAAAARAKHEVRLENAWGASVEMGKEDEWEEDLDDDGFDEEWDSDQDYEEEDEGDEW